jgi:hypothetical protein
MCLLLLPLSSPLGKFALLLGVLLLVLLLALPAAKNWNHVALRRRLTEEGSSQKKGVCST